MSLADYVALARRRWWVVALLALTAAGSAYLFSKLQTPLYRSSIRLEVSGRLDYGNTLAIEKRLNQFAQRVKTTQMVREVDRNLRLDLGPESLSRMITVGTVPDALQIQIDVDDVAPERAEALARELAQVYEESHAHSEQGKIEEERVIIRQLDEPTPSRLIWPQTSAFVLAALALGCVIGVLLVLLLDYLDDTLKTSEDVERYLGLPTLASIPLVAAADLSGRERSAAEPLRAG